MFTIPSLGKILVLVLIVLAVWYGFRLVGQFDRQRKALARQRGGNPAKRAGADVEDLVKCRGCGTYLPPGTTCSCGAA